MATYTVKSGENLYDIALKLFGSVEGIFNLLVCNTEAISETGLSLEQTIKAGTVLEYTENVLSKDILDEITKMNASVKNGEHIFKHYIPEIYINTYVKKFNQEIIKNAIKLWPTIKNYSAGTVSEDTVESFLKYLNSYCIWTTSFTESDIATLVAGNYTKATTILSPGRLYVPKMLVRQVGMESRLTYNMKKQSVMLIDWGDNKDVQMCAIANTRQELEHCYDDNGEHIISIYGDFEFSLLDLREIGGVYYPLSVISVSGDFYTALGSNYNINRLIDRT